MSIMQNITPGTLPERRFLEFQARRASLDVRDTASRLVTSAVRLASPMRLFRRHPVAMTSGVVTASIAGGAYLQARRSDRFHRLSARAELTHRCACCTGRKSLPRSLFGFAARFILRSLLIRAITVNAPDEPIDTFDS